MSAAFLHMHMRGGYLKGNCCCCMAGQSLRAAADASTKAPTALSTATQDWKAYRIRGLPAMQCTTLRISTDPNHHTLFLPSPSGPLPRCASQHRAFGAQGSHHDTALSQMEDVPSLQMQLEPSRSDMCWVCTHTLGDS